MNAPTRFEASPQQRASDPDGSAWVGANAGSGKTHVLVSRVIRLMLAGVEPARILCLTFTKAAAAEMSRRLFEWLGAWLALDDEELDCQLRELEGRPVTPEVRARARKLFTLALETPGGLKIQTIHAFSERLLQLFPVEAGIVPDFETMDERTAAEVLKAARHSVMAEADRNPELRTALDGVAALVHAAKFETLIAHVLGRRAELGAVLDDASELSRVTAILKPLFGVTAEDTRESLEATLIAADLVLYIDLIALLGKRRNSTHEKCARLLRGVLEGGPAAQTHLRELFFTNNSKPCSPTSFMTKSLRDAEPEAAKRFDAEQQRVIDQFGRISAFDMITATEHLLRLARAVGLEYEREKRWRGAYDFDDLIHRTRALLREQPSAAWVLYKLDGGIDHILIDEAQDTSPEQWDIITALAEDFFAGAGARPDIGRTLFVVGDRKQSIFSFQGADPDAFDRARRYFGVRAVAPQELRPIDLTVSYRSTGDVLSAVDQVFSISAAREGLNANISEDIVHETVRIGQAGVVELWPFAGKAEKQEPDPWTLPLDGVRTDHPSLRLARDIARTIRTWLDEKRIIASRGRPVEPGDILILVRTRNRFFDAILRELHQAAIPVAGADRVKLAEHIAIQDLVALGQFAMLPEDDHSLACVLKSPLVAHPEGRPFNDDHLFALAYHRGRQSLWSRLCAEAALEPIRATLDRWSRLGRTLCPYDFFSGVLNEGNPSIRQRMAERLGSETDDLLDAFLDLALDYERLRPPTLQGFLTWFAAAETEVKRDMEQGSGEVRIMTVHGAKGLEANIVILPDTCAPPDARTETSLLVRRDTAGRVLPLWRLSGRVEPEVLRKWRQEERLRVMAEYRRQLYVAMTRARDELYVCGYTLLDAPKEECWYGLVQQALRAHPRQVTENGVLRIMSPQAGPPKDDRPVEDRATAPIAPPVWAMAPAGIAAESPWRAPSRLVRSGMNAASASRGRAIHKLFQLLPDVVPERRDAAARRVLKRQGLSPEAREEIARAVLAIITNPDYAFMFAPGSLAEVPVAADLGGPWGSISGQIDRLAITDDCVFIIDYKSDREPPADVDRLDRAYTIQLAGYRAAVSRIFPGKSIKAALLWTEAPRLMEVPEHVLEAAFWAYHNPAAQP
jgi:ATP-dependent helicase/nuclease subunit A